MNRFTPLQSLAALPPFSPLRCKAGLEPNQGFPAAGQFFLLLAGCPSDALRIVSCHRAWEPSRRRPSTSKRVHVASHLAEPFVTEPTEHSQTGSELTPATSLVLATTAGTKALLSLAKVKLVSRVTGNAMGAIECS